MATRPDRDVQQDSQTAVQFAQAADTVEPALRWEERSGAEHAAWRQRFARRLRALLGRLPRRVPPAVRWDEEVDLGSVTRRKLYVRSEEHYWVPAYYFVPKGAGPGMPAILCLHGHSGILPYIREGDAAQRRKSRALDLDYAVYLAERATPWRRCSAAGTKPRIPTTAPRTPIAASASPWTHFCSA